MISLSSLRRLISLAALTVLASCNNTNYPDLMKVTAEASKSIAVLEQTYQHGDSISARFSARSQIIRLREKQMIMAGRIDVQTMPEFISGKMSLAEAEAKKSEIVAAATKRYTEARGMPIPEG
jgi:hypothetical protein